MTPDAPFSEFQQFITVALLFAVVSTLCLAPVLVILYRRRVDRLMREEVGEVVESPVAETPASPVPVRQVTAGELATGSGPGAVMAEALRWRLRRMAFAYAAAGLCHALIFTLFYSLKYGDLVSTRVGLIIFAVFSLATVATVLHVLAASRLLQAGVFAVIVLALYVGSGTARGLAETIFEVNVLLPTLVFVVFNLRYWRGIAPLTFILCACAAIGSVLAVQLVRQPLEPATPELWIPRLIGAMVGIGLGYIALRGLTPLYARKWFSDQEFFIAIWWLIYTLVQTIFLILTSGAHLATALVAFPIFLGVKRFVDRILLPAAEPESAPSLMVLRVFGHDRRSESFFDNLTRTWRCFGPVVLIAGRDLALRTVGPADFVAFLSGRLAWHYVSDDTSRTRAIVALDGRPDPDGRFRVNPFFCREHTWRDTFQELADRCDAVVMDLRGLAERRQGARFELQELVCRHITKPVLLIVDKTTQLAAVADVIAPEPSGTGTSAGPWTLLQVDRNSGWSPEAAGLSLLASLRRKSDG